MSISGAGGRNDQGLFNAENHNGDQYGPGTRAGAINMKQPVRVRQFWVVGALILLALIEFLPFPDSLLTTAEADLTPAGRSAIAVLVFALVLWVTEALPFHITGLLSMVMLALMRVEPFGEVVRMGFGSDIAVFMIGVMTLSAFVTISGLGKRMTVFLLSWTGTGTSAVLFGFLLVGALLSMWLSNMAVSALLVPLALSVLHAEDLKPLSSNFGRALMITCAWGPAIGGIGTPAGAGPNPLAISFLSRMAGVEVSFIRWMAFGVPASLLILVPSWLILIMVFPPEMKQLRSHGIHRSAQPAKIGREEWITVAIFLLTIVLWLTAPLAEQAFGIVIPVSMTVVLTAGFFFLPGVSRIAWAEIEREINWGSIVLVLAGISLGLALHSSGAAGWLASLLLRDLASYGPFMAALIVVAVVEFLKVIMSSNSVTAAIVIPLMIVLAQSSGTDVLTLALPAALASSLGFILVTSAPTNVIAYTPGYFSMADMAKAGVLLTAVSVPIVAGVIYVGLLIGL